MEKARLAQENARLARVNTGLQELLEFKMNAPAQYPDTEQAGLDDWGVMELEHGAMHSTPIKSSGRALAAFLICVMIFIHR